LIGPRKIKIGYGLDESIQMGPVRDSEKEGQIVKYIELGINEGARMILDGRKPNIIGGLTRHLFPWSQLSLEKADPQYENRLMKKYSVPS